MDYIHIKNLEEYNPGYKDRGLIWFKFYFKMVQGDPDFELIESEIDKWRYVSMIALELQSKKPLPNSDAYFRRKGFNLSKRSMLLTLKVLRGFVEYVTKDSKPCTLEKSREEKNRVEKSKGINPKFIIPTKEEFTAYADSKGIPRSEAGVCWYYYDKLGWTVGKDQKPMVSWKSALSGWWIREKNKV